MSEVFKNIKVGLDEDLEERLQWLVPGYSSYHILKKSVDARRKSFPHFVYSIEVFEEGETPPAPAPDPAPFKYTGPPVLVVGSGPAGLFAALRLCERGIPCHLFEQGSTCDKRLKKITRFWRYGELDPRNNVGFGEGGAGLYSDGKLITRIKSQHIPYVMEKLVQFGAPEEIRYLANPHVGSDRIRRLIPVMRKYLLEKGCNIHFDSKVTEIKTGSQGQVTGLQLENGDEYKSDQIILACGHSAEDMFQHLQEIGVAMEGKSFAVGLRIEHPQELINKIQYREAAGHPKLGAANYRVACHNQSEQVGVYSFCMCPGGYVLSCATDTHQVVSNGMSNYNRNSRYANSAIVVSVDFEKSFGGDLMAGVRFRRELERKAYEQVLQAGGQKELPAQSLEDFLEGRSGSLQKSSCPSGIVPARLDLLLPENLKKHFVFSLQKFEQSMKGFISPEAQLHGIESRTSCPLRITRDSKSLQSISHPGLFPAGEGAGYAGGITSAACDGIRVVEALISSRNLA